MPVSIMAWPGPAHFPSSLALALRLDNRQRPQDLYRALLVQLRSGLDRGEQQVLLPPPAPPAMPEDDDPEYLQVHWRSMDIDTQTWASFWPHGDTEDGNAALVVANRCCEWAGMWANYRLTVFNQLFEKVERVNVHAPLPAAPQLCDSGELNHIRLQLGEQSAHLLAYDEGLLLPQSMRSKQSGARAAHLLNMQRVGVRSGTNHYRSSALAHRRCRCRWITRYLLWAW